LSQNISLSNLCLSPFLFSSLSFSFFHFPSILFSQPVLWKRPLPLSRPLLSHRVSLSVQHTNGSSVHLPSQFTLFPFPSFRRSLTLSLSRLLSRRQLGPFYRLAFLHSPYPELKVPEPAQARKAFGGPATPVGSRPCFASFLLSFPFCARPCTALREDTRRRKWRVS